MSIPGPAVYQQLMDAHQRLSEQLENERLGMKGVDEQHQQLDVERDEALRSLAEHYLPELTADAIDSTWREVQQEFSEILLQKEDDNRLLSDKLIQLQGNRDATEQRLEKEGGALDAAVAEQNEISAVVESRLQEDSSFVQLADRAAAAEVALQRAELNLHEIDQDAVRKLPAYQSSALFKYL